jgi:hypothetical protein
MLAINIQQRLNPHRNRKTHHHLLGSLPDLFYLGVRETFNIQELLTHGSHEGLQRSVKVKDLGRKESP